MLRYQLEPVKRYKITRSASGSPCEILRTQQSLGFTRFRLLSLSFLSRRDGQWLAIPRVVLARGLSFRRLSDVWSWLWKQLRYIHTSTLPQMTARAPCSDARSPSFSPHSMPDKVGSSCCVLVAHLHALKMRQRALLGSFSFDLSFSRCFSFVVSFSFSFSFSFILSFSFSFSFRPSFALSFSRFFSSPSLPFTGALLFGFSALPFLASLSLSF